MSLSERIAALNKAKPSPQLSPHAGAASLPRAGNGVKEKAARFDGLGAAPAPRGSFGLGAPMSSGQKSNRELWGNRIPSVGGKPHKNADGPNGIGSKGTSSVGSRSPSRSRKSSMELAKGLVGGRVQDTRPADPLTAEAVDSLGAAALVSPVGDAHAFRSVPQSVVDDQHDASSSVAAEAEDDLHNRSMLDVSITGADGRASPALTSSTVSDSALKEAPPILSPSASSAQLHDSGSRPYMSLYDPRSVSATQGSSSVPAFLASSSTVLDDAPSTEVEALHISSPESTSSDQNTSPLPLSSHLLQSLQASMPTTQSSSGMDTPRSVMVETGSVDGKAKLDDIDIDISDDRMMVDESPEAPCAVEADVDLTSDKGGEDIDLDIQPDLRLAAPVLPLSSAHLKSLNVQSAINRSALASGLETPRSMIVEDGSDGSGSKSPMVMDSVEAVDNDYYTSNPPSGIPTPPGFVIDLPPDEKHPARTSPPPLSPAVLAYALDDDTHMASHPDAASTGAIPSPKLQIPGSPDPVDMSTPVAAHFLLPDVQTTPPAAGTDPDPMQELDESPQAEAADSDTFRGPGHGVVSSSGIDTVQQRNPLPEFNISVDNEITTLSASELTPCPSPRARSRPRSMLSEEFLSERSSLPPLDTAQYYQNKPLPPPPTGQPTEPSTPNTSLPATPIIIDAFPPVPSYRPQPRNPPLLSTKSPVTHGLGITSTLTPAISLSQVSNRSSVPAGSWQPQLPPSRIRPRSTCDPATPTVAVSGLRRTASSIDVKDAGQEKRRKKPQLVPGVWIGDDDVRDEDDDGETGWANIVVTKHVIS